MKLLAVLFALTGCSTELTNRQLARYVVPIGIVVGAITVAAVAGGCKQGCNLSEGTR